MKKGDKIIIIGAGPAGLSTAYHLIKAGIIPVVIEQDECVGGLSKTIYENHYGTDIGPHRFFTKNDKVMNLWKELLPVQGAPACDDILLERKVAVEPNGPNPETDDKVLLKRKRFSRIYFSKHFFDYPIKFKTSNFTALGVFKTIIAGLSYLKSCVYKIPETNLESFIINRFGRFLYELFFEEYTQKICGVHPSEISKEWGLQRIKGISLLKVFNNAFCKLFKIKNEKEISMIDEYFYPKFGSSQIWEEMADRIKSAGCKIILNSRVIQINKDKNKIISVKVENTKTGEISEIFGGIFVSSMPIKCLLTNMNDVPKNISEIAENLKYRDFILVNFITKKINLKNNTDTPTVKDIAPDSWIYLQDRGISAGRLDIMNNFSPYIIKNYKDEVSINLEYFCNENDEFWQNKDENIIDFAISELKKLKIIDNGDIKYSKVIRVKKAYPAYIEGYKEFENIKNYINTLDNLYCIGRNGQHKYNNMDYSVLSGIIAAEIIQNGRNKNCLWDVNTDKKYQEINS